MKKSHYVIIGATLALASCMQPVMPPHHGATVVAHPAAVSSPAHVPAAPARPGSYLALPGQAPVAVDTDADAAFDRQVAAYQGTPAPQAVVPAVDPMTGAPVAAVVPAPAVAPMAPMGAEVAPGMTPGVDPMSAATPGKINYTVKITNNTPGRLFIEAQDGAGTIYPCGFMNAGQSFSTPMTNADPIHGQITVVVRDPDKPDTPEIRRYKVTPPNGYANKEVGVSVIPGGIYQTSLDGVVTYTSPPQPRTAAPAPAPAPAAPAATPAGM